MRKKKKTDPLKYGVSYSFSGSLTRVEEWLRNNCEGRYSLSFDGIKEATRGLNQLQVLVLFENLEDRERFKRAARENRIV